jgi:hypothetical protein
MPQLLAPQLAEALPAKGMAVDDEGVGFCHRRTSRGSLDGRMGLQAVQEIGGALRMRGSRKNRALVAFQHFEPVIDIGGVVVAKLGRQFEVGAQEGRAKLGDLS